MSSAGRFKIDVWGDGYPVQCVLSVDGHEVAKFHHQDIADLQHVISQARKVVIAALPEKYKGEV